MLKKKHRESVPGKSSHSQIIISLFHRILIILLLVTILSPPIAYGEDIQFGYDGSSETNFYSWRSRNNRSGYQYVTPTNLSMYATKPGIGTLNLGVRTAHIVSHNTSRGSKGAVRSISDTSISASISYDKYIIKPWLSMDVNVPTGKSRLKGTEKNALMDENLVGQTRFGEGVNLSPAIGFIFQMSDKNVLSVGSSYNIKGKYEPDGDTYNELDPGDIFTGTMQYQRLTQNSLTSLGVVYSRESTTSLGDINNFYQPGERFDIYATRLQQFFQRHTVSGVFRYSTIGKNKRFDPFTDTFNREDKKGTGDVYFMGLTYAYQYNKQLSTGIDFGYLLRNDNDFQPENDIFIPERKKLSVKLFSNYMVNKNLSLYGSVSYFDMRDKKTAFLPKIHYTGINASLGFSLSFW